MSTFESIPCCFTGVSMFSFPRHHFDPIFIITGFVCAAIGRAVNVYPLAFLINLGRNPKMPWNFQHMLFFAGLRGAMSFALVMVVDIFAKAINLMNFLNFPGYKKHSFRSTTNYVDMHVLNSHNNCNLSRWCCKLSTQLAQHPSWC